MATTCVVYDDDDRPGQTVVGDEDETTKYEEDDDDGVVGSGRRGIAVLVTELSSSDNVDADFDDGHLRLAGVTRRAVINRRICPRVQRPRRWRYSLGSSSRGRCRGRCKRFGRDDGDDDDEDNGMVDDDSYGDVYGLGNDVQYNEQFGLCHSDNEPSDLREWSGLDTN